MQSPGGKPTRVGRYELGRELGRGMMGVVYEARDSMLDRVVALKTIHLAFSVSEADRKNFEERFLTEARSAAGLSHPGIVVVHDVGRDASGTLFMALEYLRGRPLSAFYGAGAPMEWRRALGLVARVAEALHHAHSAGVVHRDIKPANIMLLDSGEPKVMDFGLAKLQKSQLSLTSSGQFFGTPLFMSPEQASGQPLDGRSDLFSLGSVAYALLTGRAPFEADNLPQTFLKVAGEDPVPPSQLNPALPPAVDALLARMMAKKPDDRYPDGRAVAEDIADVLEGRPPRHGVVAAGPRTGAPGVGSPGRGAAPATASPTRAASPAAAPPRATRRRGPSLAVAGGALALLVVGVLAGTVAARRLGTRKPSRTGPVAAADRPAPAPGAAVAPSSDETETLARAVAARLGGDLDGSRELLVPLVERDPAVPGAAELLEQVETELWARDQLPLAFGAEHNHRLGSCRGELTLEPEGLSYSSRDHGLWHWSFGEIQEMTRKNRRELEIVTNESEALRLGGAKRYDFKLTSAPLEREVWDRFARLARSR